MLWSKMMTLTMMGRKVHLAGCRQAAGRQALGCLILALLIDLHWKAGCSIWLTEMVTCRFINL